MVVGVIDVAVISVVLKVVVCLVVDKMVFLCIVLGVLLYPWINKKSSGGFSLTFLVRNDDDSILDIITFAKVVGLEYFVIRDDNCVANDKNLLDVDECACVNEVDIRCFRVVVSLGSGVGIMFSNRWILLKTRYLRLVTAIVLLEVKLSSFYWKLSC